MGPYFTMENRIAEIMTTGEVKRSYRIQGLHQKALRGKYTKKGKFLESELINDAKAIGVGIKTAESYADSVISMLKRAGHLK